MKEAKEETKQKTIRMNEANRFIVGTQLGRIQGDGIYNTANSMIINSRRIFSHHLQSQKPIETEPSPYLLRPNKKSCYLNDYTNTVQSTGQSTITFPTVSFTSLRTNFITPMNTQSSTQSDKANAIERLFYKSTDISKSKPNQFIASRNQISYPQPYFDIHNQLSSSRPSMSLSPGFTFKPPLNSNQSDAQSEVNDNQPLHSITVHKKLANEREYTVKNPWSISQYTFKQYHNQKYHLSLEEYGMENDRFNNIPSQGLFCLFKGYGGKEVAEYASKHFPDIFLRNIITNPNNATPYKDKAEAIANKPKKDKRKGLRTSIETVLINSFQKLDNDIKYMNCLSVGSTACIVLITKENEALSGFNQEKRMIYCANIGTCECIIADAVRTKRLSSPHSLDTASEKKRISQTGGIIYQNKVYGQWNITRAFGLFSFKPYGITSVPDVVKYCLSARDKYLLIASNGVFDVLSERELLFLCNGSDSTEEIADNIIKNALIRNSKENISVYVIKL